MIRYFSKVTVVAIALILVFLTSCQEDDGVGVGVPGVQTEWLVPVSEIFDGGPGKDGIPSIDDPKFISIEEVGDQIRDFEFVTGIIIGDEIKLYPHTILDYHEIVNDRLGNQSYALNYCPLTGTSYAWNRILNGTETTFGVSGLLYQNNLIPYDRSSENYYSQILCQSIQGSSLGDSVAHIDVVEMRWSGWKTSYQDAQVLSLETGFDRPYGNYPYGDYRSTSDLLFPQSSIDNRLFAKERVLFVQIESSKKVYRFPGDQDGFFSYEDELNGEEIVIVGDVSLGLIRAYNKESLLEQNGGFVNSEPFSGLFEDGSGNTWNVFGSQVDGVENHLRIPKQTVGFWFAIAAFNPRIEIF